MPQRPPPPPHLRLTLPETVEVALEGVPPTITIPLDATVSAALDALIAKMSAEPTVAALGIRISRPAAARAALLKGVETLLAPGTKQAAPDAPSDILLGLGAVPSPEIPQAATEAAPPPNWSLSLAPVTGSEAALHAWYEARGWKRYVATTKRGPATLYWAANPLYRPLCPEPFDAAVTTAAIAGYGMAHLVPDGWAAQGADGAEVREAGSLPSLRTSMGDGVAGTMPGKASVLS